MTDLAVPSEISSYLFGGLHYPFWKFLAAICVAESIYALGVVIAGASLLEAKPAVLAATIGVPIVVTAWTDTLPHHPRGI